MRLRVHSAVLTTLVLALFAVAAERGSAQSAEWSPPLTPDGQPDIQGVWTNFDPTPFEAPSEVDIERLAPLAKWFPGTNLPPSEPKPPEPGERRAVSLGSLFFDGPGSADRNTRRRSMVVDPPTGRIPVRESAVAVRNERLINLTDSWLNHTEWERCITRGVPGGIFPPGYGAGYRIIQAPGYVVIQYEMIHEARIIRLDGRPPVPSGIRLWNGDSRGRWEGKHPGRRSRQLQRQGRHRDERGHTRRARDSAHRRLESHRAVYLCRRGYDRVRGHRRGIQRSTRRRGRLPCRSTQDLTYELYEYACHEGNYGLENSLSGGRAEDRAEAEGR